MTPRHGVVESRTFELTPCLYLQRPVSAEDWTCWPPKPKAVGMRRRVPEDQNAHGDGDFLQNVCWFLTILPPPERAKRVLIPYNPATSRTTSVTKYLTDASLTSVKWLIVTQWMKQEELNAIPFCSAGLKIFMKDYNRLHARRRYQEMPYDCGTSVAKYLLCLFNFVFFVSTLSFYATRLQSIPRLHFNIYVQVFQVASFPHVSQLYAPLLVSLTCHTFCR